MTARLSLAGRSALVTGASGFIGHALTERLLEARREVHAVSRAGGRARGIRWWSGGCRRHGGGASRRRRAI